ncbi:hypothetical protein HY745_08650 [Candidatus Desantisbacteria bacterium]|nr:hypothetical protein [Candidatus Desantisbacteria bacterium]
MAKLKFLGILFQFIGIILILFFQQFMQEVYTRKVTISGEKMILMIMPENRMVLWIGLFLLIIGFILILIKEFGK